MSNRTFVVGVGMTKFEKPGSKDWDYPDMASEAGTKALEDAGIAYDDVEQAFVGYCYGDSTSGQRAVYELGLTGIPVVNVNNNCSTGSSALFMARQARARRAGRLRARARLREDGEGLARRQVHRPHEPDRQAPDGDGRGARARGRARRAADVRQRRPRAHGALRLRRPTTSRGSAGRTTSTRSTTRTRSSRTSTRSTEIKSAKMIYEPLTKLQCSPDLRRVRRARSSPASGSSTSTTCGTRPSRSPARRW